MQDCRPAVAKPRQVLSPADLQDIVQRAVSAMVFLEARHVVHRALAARHFLVGRDARDIRLADLGRTRDIYVVRGGGVFICGTVC